MSESVQHVKELYYIDTQMQSSSDNEFWGGVGGAGGAGGLGGWVVRVYGTSV